MAERNNPSDGGDEGSCNSARPKAKRTHATCAAQAFFVFLKSKDDISDFQLNSIYQRVSPIEKAPFNATSFLRESYYNLVSSLNPKLCFELEDVEIKLFKPLSISQLEAIYRYAYWPSDFQLGEPFDLEEPESEEDGSVVPPDAYLRHFQKAVKSLPPQERLFALEGNSTAAKFKLQAQERLLDIYLQKGIFQRQPALFEFYTNCASSDKGILGLGWGLYESSSKADMSSTSGTPESWITSFCSLLGHEYFAEISEDFIEDDFNLTGLQQQVAMYKEALEVGSPVS